MKKYELKLIGMTCSGCENRISSQLRKIEGVVKVSANATSGSVHITTSDAFFDVTILTQCVQTLGYEVTAISPVLSNSKAKFQQLLQWLGLAVLVIIIWSISPSLGLNRFELPSSISYVSLFLIGLATSIHCLGMCGGISMSIGLNASHFPLANPTQQLLKTNGAYQLGRVISYTLIGGFAGLVGATFSIGTGFKIGVSIGAGLLMIIMGLNFLGLFSSLSKYLPKPPANLRLLREKAKRIGPFAVGLANGFIPCGPLQAMQLYALSTTSPVTGALSMFFFSIGTVPAMLGFGILSGKFGKNLKGAVLKFSGILVIFLGLIALERGLSMTEFDLSDFTQALSGQSESTVQSSKEITASDGVLATLKGDYQEVTITVTPSGYQPIIVQKGMPVKWNLQASEENLTGCNSGIIAKEFKIDKALSVGDNWVEFLPQESGTYRYTCWMGMIRSKIYVVDDLSQIK